jgi:deoxycytidylate deaminase
MISVSKDIIAKNAQIVGEQYDPNSMGSDRVADLQRIGSKLRNSMSNDYLAEKCVEKIAIDRAQKGYKEVAGNRIPLPRRKAYILDSLKHPGEYELLRDVYGDSLWLFGVFAPEEVRRDRLISKGFDGEQIQGIFNIDEEEGVKHGQKVRDTIEMFDFFIRNNGSNTSKLARVIERYLDLIFGIEVSTPTRDEAAMYTAVSAASSSACLSRQVGAAIYSATGELLGKGSNDVPKKGGGLYSVEDEDGDDRCYKYGGKNCHNDERKNYLYKSVVNGIVKDAHMKKPKDFEAVISTLKKTDIKGLIEYSRAVHAEMDAIISIARSGKSGILGSTLYCTTFPCHSCARHIVASAIARVVYIEPYPKSLATVLHKDAISVRESDKESHVVFLQYQGVAPKNMIRLFKQHGDRKSDGKAIERERRNSAPVSRSPLDGFATREQIVVHRVEAAEKKIVETQEGVEGGKDENGSSAMS